MSWHRVLIRPLAVAAILLPAPVSVHAEQSFAETARDVNQKLVKLFGSGGFQRLASYGTGVVISPDGYVLTVASHILDTQDLRVHTYDGRRLHAKVIVVEPELDVALVKIDKADDLPFFDIVAAAKAPLVETGTGILAFSNLFQIATMDEPMSVQRGVISAYSKLLARKGVNEAPFNGDVYFIDAITNNPGAGGGVITTRKGELIGLIGKELKNTQSETWINYATPISAKIDVRNGDQTRTISILEIVENKEKYKPIGKRDKKESFGGYTGIVLVPNVVERTPPYVEEVEPNSPAARSGMRPDDLIVYIDGLQVVSIKEFKEIIDTVRPDTEVKLEVRRGDKLTTLTVKLEAPPKKAK
jgi:serine protease Do